jgi:hypothetical protein
MMLANLKVVLRSEPFSKHSKHTCIRAYAIQETAEGPVEGTNLLHGLAPVKSFKEAKALVRKVLEGHVKNVEFV